MNQYVSSQSELRKRTFVGTTDYSRKERASGYPAMGNGGHPASVLSRHIQRCIRKY